MKTNEIDPFPQTLVTAVTKLKNRLQHTYEQAYPECSHCPRRRRSKGVGVILSAIASS
jgi:hypothetical protein